MHRDNKFTAKTFDMNSVLLGQVKWTSLIKDQFIKRNIKIIRIFIDYEGNSNIHFDFVSIFIKLSSVFLIEKTRCSKHRCYSKMLFWVICVFPSSILSQFSQIQNIIICNNSFKFALNYVYVLFISNNMHIYNVNKFIDIN